MQNPSQEPMIEISGLSKNYGAKKALDDVNLTIGRGEIVGLIGPNGAGKSTLLAAVMGLLKYSGSLRVFGRDPFHQRAAMLEHMSYIADVASLPGWMKVRDLFKFVGAMHPRFDSEKAMALLSATNITLNDRIDTLSKGMKTRLHLITILAIDTDLLVLDEPTIGLDVLVRRDFQDRLVQDFYNQQRSILITTHQVDEIENILTRVVFINQGRITLDLEMAELRHRFTKLVVTAADSPNLEGLELVHRRELPGRTELIFKGGDGVNARLATQGEVLTPSLEDLFVAINTPGSQA